MDCLVNLTGTRFDKTKDFIERYKEDGILWFLEACDLNVFSIRRAMWQMEQAGWFEHVKAFLIGRPLCFGQDMMGLDPYQAVLPVALSHHVPVIMDVDLGHLPPMMPLIVGSLADVTVSGNDIRIDMAAALTIKQAERVISCRAHLNSRIPGSRRTLLLTPTCLLRAERIVKMFFPAPGR